MAGRIAWIASGCAHLLIAWGLWQFGEQRAHRENPGLATFAEKAEHPITMAFVEDAEPQRIDIKFSEPIQPAKIEPPVTPIAEVRTEPPVPKVVDVVQNLQPAKFETRQPELNIPVPPSKVVPTAAPRFSEGQKLHGLLPDGRKAVYLLDRSASMGLVRENFEAARAGLFVTMQGTRPGASFQALVYSSDVQTLLGGPKNAWVKMDLETPEKIRRALAGLSCEGLSRHDLALRAALAQEADYVLWTTDADDAELASLKPILKSVRKPVAVYLCRVSGGKIEAPAEWK